MLDLSKVCTICNTEKSIKEFYFRKDNKKYRNECKQCKLALDKVYAEKNKKKIKEYQSKYYRENAEYVKARQRHYRVVDPEKLRARRRKHYRENKAQYIQHARNRELKQGLATPKWADLDGIAFFYQNCPDGWHVDHIIPLQGKLASGLHVLENLQYLPAAVNTSKSNKFDLEYNPG